jgi:succinate dehydrogenase/fumarate reductase cytochrome b subunit
MLSVESAGPKEEGDCGRGDCGSERQWMAITGFVLGAVLILHLAFNVLGLWPALFELTASLNHRLGGALPSLEIGLVLVPLAIHVVLGVRILCRDKLVFGVEKQHRGSDVRYWLQRVTAVILLVFLAFHLATTHRWGVHLIYQATHWPAAERYAAGGLYEAQHAYASASDAQWHFWDDRTGSPANLLVSELILLVIAAAVYHLANGVATGSEVFGLAAGARRKSRLWRVCIGAGFALAAIGMVGWYAFAPGLHP